MINADNDFSGIRHAVNQFFLLKESEWLDFSSRLTRKHYSKGEFLIRQGQVENYIYFLNNGITHNYFFRGRKDFTVDFHFTGDFVTAYYSLVTRLVSPVFIVALEDTDVYAISFESLNKLYVGHHSVERIGRLIAEQQYVKRLDKYMDLLALTAEERYEMLLQRSPALIQQLSVRHLSSYLGIQPESLSRIRKLYLRN